MKIECGTDIIEIDRIKKTIESLSNRFIKKVFTDKEIAYCESKKVFKFQHYAARFAAKEAVYKAISKKKGISWKDIEIINEENGKPKVYLYNEYNDVKIKEISLSMSHCEKYATANCFVLKEE